MQHSAGFAPLMKPVSTIPLATDGLATILWDVDSLHPEYLGIPAEELLAAVTEHLWDEQNVRVGRTVAYLTKEIQYGPLIDTIERLRVLTRSEPARRPIEAGRLADDLKALTAARECQTVVLLSSDVNLGDILDDLERAGHFLTVVHNDGALHAACNRAPRRTAYRGGAVIHLAKDIPRLAAIRDDFPVVVGESDASQRKHCSVRTLFDNPARTHLIELRNKTGRWCKNGAKCHRVSECGYAHRATDPATIIVAAMPGQLPTPANVIVGGEVVKAGALYRNRAWYRLRDDPASKVEWCPDDGAHCADPDACDLAHRFVSVGGEIVPRCAVLRNAIYDRLLHDPCFGGKWCHRQEDHDPMTCAFVHPRHADTAADTAAARPAPHHHHGHHAPNPQPLTV